MCIDGTCLFMYLSKALYLSFQTSMSSNTQSAIAFKVEHQNTFIKGMLQHKVKLDMCL